MLPCARKVGAEINALYQHPEFIHKSLQTKGMSPANGSVDSSGNASLPKKLVRARNGNFRCCDEIAN